MFENPRPTFFASMYNNPASFREGQKDSPPPRSPDGNQSADQRLALDPGGSLSASPGTKEGQHATPPEGSQDDGGAGTNKSALVPVSETEGDEEEQNCCVDDPCTTDFERCGVLSGGGNNNSRIVSASEDEDRDGALSLSAGSEVDTAGPIGPESLPKFMESLRLGTVPPSVECILPEPSQHGAMGSLAPTMGGGKAQKSEPGQQSRSGEDCGSSFQAAAVGATREDGPLDVAAAEEQTRVRREQPGDGKGGAECFLEPEEIRQGTHRVSSSPGAVRQSEWSREDVMLSQPSARLNNTRINGAGEGDNGGLVTEIDENLPKKHLRSPRQLAFEASADCGGSGQARSDGVPPSSRNSSVHDQNRSIGSGVTSSPPVACKISGDTANVGSVPVHASAGPGTSASISGARLQPTSPEGPRREPEDDEDDHASAQTKAESPEMLRLGSASPDSKEGSRGGDQSFGNRSWEAGAVAGRFISGHIRRSKDKYDSMFSLAHSPDGAPSARDIDSQAFGSMLSPAIGSFGRIGGVGRDVDALSPLALARSLDDSEHALGDADDDGGHPLPGVVGGDYGGLSPVLSARSERSFGSDERPSPLQQQQQQPKKKLFAEKSKDGDEDITLTPEVARSSAVAPSPSSFATYSGAGIEREEEEEGGCDLGDLQTGANTDGAEGHESGLMPPPLPRQPSISPQHKEQQQQQQWRRRRQSESPEAARWFSSNSRRGRTAFADRTNTPAGRHGKSSKNERSVLSGHANSKKCGGGGGGCVGGGYGEHVEQVSIGSFSESEIGRSRSESSILGGGEARDMENAHDSSLAEGTPRRPRASSREDLGGFYPPLQVAHVAKKDPQNSGLSALQRSTLQWMLWREGREEGKGEGRDGGTSVAAAVSFCSDDAETLDVNVKGGVLGHLSSEEAWRCVHSLLHGQSALDDAAGENSDRRTPPVHPVTGLPCGATLIVTPTKEAAWEWTSRLESSAGSLSVLSYVMPLRERRRLTAKQAAAFDVVVTTYDVLKAKEVPRGVEAKKAASPRIWALPGSKQWRTRNTKEGSGRKPAASKTDHMVSLLHGVWWNRIVADGAQLLGNLRSARAVAALALVGTARWCVVERESMAMVENTSERMRCLAAFLRIPANLAMVQAAEKLFYHSRPSHIAPLHPRSSSAGGDNSLSLSEDDAGRRSPGSSHRKRRSSSMRGTSGVGKPTTKEGGGLSAMRKNSGGGAGERERRAGGRGASRVGAGALGNLENEFHSGEGAGGRAAAGGRGLSRGDVEYTTTTLRLRRARG
eukprot:g1350.t1